MSTTIGSIECQQRRYIGVTTFCGGSQVKDGFGKLANILVQISVGTSFVYMNKQQLNELIALLQKVAEE